MAGGGRALFGVAIAVILWGVATLAYQVGKKPTALFLPVSGALAKAPAETWRDYGPLFERYSTRRVSPELLAALAQVEGAGNPIAQTYWRWNLWAGPLDWFRPASSAVGMYQITNGTFAAAKRYCIRDHAVLEAGSLPVGCAWTGLYSRVVPAHAVELTSAYLDRAIGEILARRRVTHLAPGRVRELAAVIHLCGAGAGDEYVRRGSRLAAGGRCGDHDARTYVARVTAAIRTFAALRARAVQHDSLAPPKRKVCFGRIGCTAGLARTDRDAANT
jgi:hypothetical protein